MTTGLWSVMKCCEDRLFQCHVIPIHSQLSSKRNIDVPFYPPNSALPNSPLPSKVVMCISYRYTQTKPLVSMVLQSICRECDKLFRSNTNTIATVKQLCRVLGTIPPQRVTEDFGSIMRTNFCADLIVHIPRVFGKFLLQ